jgi:hypothetical protein
MHFEGNNRLVVFLLNINQIEDASQCIHAARGVEVAVTVVNVFKSLAIKSSLPNKQIGNRRFTEVSNNFLPPIACSNVCVCRDEGARGTSPIRGATKMRLNNFLCVEL